MEKIKVMAGFRFGGTYYGASAKEKEIPADAAKWAVEQGLAEDPAAAEANKNQGNAPENK